MTKFVILSAEREEDEKWSHVSTVDARSGQAAIRHYLGDGSDGRRMVAVPARSWKPVTVKVETKTQLKFS